LAIGRIQSGNSIAMGYNAVGMEYGIFELLLHIINSHVVESV
jgi:hypothetical protein